MPRDPEGELAILSVRTFARVVSTAAKPGIEEAARAMRNIRNHLDADPTAKIVVVTNGGGIDFLLEGAEFAKGSKFTGPIGELANRGVQFRVCENTLTAREIPADRVAMEATVVPSGVAEAARLQAREKFVYLKP